MLGSSLFHILWTSRSSFSPCPYGIVVVVFHFDSGGRKAKKTQPGQKPWSNPSLQTKFRNSIQFEKQPWDDIAPGMVLSIGLWRLLRMVIGCGCNWILYDFIFFTLYNTWSGKILHFVCLRLKKGVAFGPASVDAGLDYTWPYSNSEVHTNQRRIDTSIPIQCEPIPRTMKKALMKMFPACPCFSLWEV